jgi:hypothetical protein
MIFKTDIRPAVLMGEAQNEEHRWMQAHWKPLSPLKLQHP